MVELRFLVPVSESRTLRRTVTTVARRLQQADRGAGTPLVRFVALDPGPAEAPVTGAEDYQTTGMLDRARVWLTEDLDELAETITIETERIGVDEYVSTPDDVADILAADVTAHEIDRIVVDPEYDPHIGVPLLRPLGETLRDRDLPVLEPTPGRTRRSVSVLTQTTPLRLGALFTLSFVFYQTLAGGVSVFDLVTGTMAGVIVAIGLGRLSLQTDPTSQTPLRLLRGLVYIPYLLKEILISNVRVAALILHPRLPIDPQMVTYRPSFWAPLPTTVLANSLTLTPGTLTVRAHDGYLLVHTLTPWARAGIEGGSLETAVRFLFGGRAALPVASPNERDAVEPVSEEDS